MPSGRARRLLGALRFRLAFWNSASILALVLATFIGLRQGLAWVLHRELDAQLREDVTEVSLILDRFWPDWPTIKEELDRKAVSHKAHSWFARVFDLEGNLKIATVGAPELVAPLDEGPKPFSFEGNRLVQVRRSRPGGGYFVRVGCSLDSVTDDVANLTRILAFGGIAFLVVAPLSGWLLAGRATRPLAAVVQTAARTRPDHLDERVPLRGTGDELDQLAETFNGLLDRLGAHLDRQRAFVANAAHELRTPLAALRASAEVALSQDRTAEEYRERLADVIESSDSLVALVNQLLLLAEGQAGPVRSPMPVALDRVASRVVDMFGGVAEQRGLRLALDAPGPAWVMGNEGFLRQVASNLVDNALKFTPGGGAVRVSVWADDGEAMLRVRDTGPGIPPEDQPHLFERFFRADRARRREGGSGLGLSICQALVASHGGSIRIDSTPGRGTEVTVTLPACPAGHLTKL
ncbi:MAG: ATP-binding protein [Gemmataceae bacterium]